MYWNYCWGKHTNLKHLHVETLSSSVYDLVCSHEWNIWTLDVGGGLPGGCWPINRSNRFSDFLRLDRLDRFVKIIKSIFSKFWKREFQFFSDFQNFFGLLKFREKCFFLVISQISRMFATDVVAYSWTSSDVEHKIHGSKSTVHCRIPHKIGCKWITFWKGFDSFH